MQQRILYERRDFKYNKSMLFLVIPIALGFLGVIVYFALSKESSRIVRLAALIALGAVILSVLVCGIIVLLSLGGGGEPVMPDFLATEQPEPPAKTSTFVMAVVMVFLLLFLGMVVFLSLREQRKTAERKPEALGEDNPYSS
jgi:heme A synthase